VRDAPHVAARRTGAFIGGRLQLRGHSLDMFAHKPWDVLRFLVRAPRRRRGSGAGDRPAAEWRPGMEAGGRDRPGRRVGIAIARLGLLFARLLLRYSVRLSVVRHLPR